MKKVVICMLLAGTVAIIYGMRGISSNSDKKPATQAAQMYEYIPVQMGEDGVPILDSTKWDTNLPFVAMPIPIK